MMYLDDSQEFKDHKDQKYLSFYEDVIPYRMGDDYFDKVFFDKKILLLGASSNVVKHMNKCMINFEDYDIIIKCNHHWADFPARWRRTDVVYHGLKNIPGKEGKHFRKFVNQKKESWLQGYKGLEDLLLICPPRKTQIRKINWLSKNSIYHAHISQHHWFYIAKAMRALPLMGVVALLHCSMFKPKLIHCFGMDFYQSGYYSGQKNSVTKSCSEPPIKKRHGSHGKKHKLNHQFEWFFDLLLTGKGFEHITMVRNQEDVSEFLEKYKS